MANLVRIRDVCVYATLDENAAESHQVKELLKSYSIPCNNLFWADPEEAKNCFAPLNTWAFTEDGVNVTQKTFSKFPIITWRNIFDNDVQGVNAVVGLTELQNSQLILNQDKVVRPS